MAVLAHPVLLFVNRLVEETVRLVDLLFARHARYCRRHPPEQDSPVSGDGGLAVQWPNKSRLVAQPHLKLATENCAGDMQCIASSGQEQAATSLIAGAA